MELAARERGTTFQLTKPQRKCSVPPPQSSGSTSLTRTGGVRPWLPTASPPVIAQLCLTRTDTTPATYSPTVVMTHGMTELRHGQTLPDCAQSPRQGPQRTPKATASQEGYSSPGQDDSDTLHERASHSAPLDRHIGPSAAVCQLAVVLPRCSTHSTTSENPTPAGPASLVPRHSPSGYCLG